MGRLIDADALKKIIDEKEKWILELIDEQPTAYEAEKVVEELGKIKGYYGYFGSEECEYVSYDDAIDIVKRGGIE